MKRVVFVLAVALVLGCASSTHAALTDNGGNFRYDTEQNITWYDFASSPVNWSSATSWAAAQTVGGFTAGDWSLPAAPGANRGSNTEAETDYLPYGEPANSAGGPLDDTGHFTPNWFWTGAEYTPHRDRAWDFGAGDFRNENDRDRYHFHARHYRRDEGATTPMPTAALLFGPCFIGLAAIRRRFKK